MSFLDARDHGSKVGSGGHASAQNEAIDRRERLRRLALETIDLSKDPYFMRNHLGQYECRLCLTLHNNEGNYLAHTQGKRHQQNMAKRAAREAAEKPAQPAPQRRAAVKKTVKIGRPGYRVTKQFDSDQDQRSFAVPGKPWLHHTRTMVEYPEIDEDVKPRHRFMSAYEQKKEAWDKAYQYLLFAADPYEVIAFKIPNIDVDRSENFFTHWDAENKIYSLQVPFKPQRLTASGAAAPAGGAPQANGGPPRPPPGMQGGPPPMPPQMGNGFPGPPPGQGFPMPPGGPPPQGAY